MLMENHVWLDDALHPIESLPSQFYIDAEGAKHLTQQEEAWQELSCNYEDELTQENGQWRVRNESDRLKETKQKAKTTLTGRFSQARSALTEQADTPKLASWNDKAQRASRILAKTASEQDHQILQAELDARGRDGETLQSLAQAQKEKAEALALKAARLSGLEKKALADIEGKRTENTVNALLVQVQRQIETL